MLGFVLLGLFLPSLTTAGDGCEEWAARLVSLQGRVEQRVSGEAGWSQSSPDARLCPGDALRIGANSRAAVQLRNETLVRFDQLTTVIFPESEEQEQNLLLKIFRGIGYFFSRTPKKIEIRAPFVNAAIEGTEFLVAADPTQSRVLVLDGVVRASNAEGELRLTSGEGAVAGHGEAPRQILVVNPEDAVKWTLYYPPVIGFGIEESDIPAGARNALDAFDRGDISGALSALDQTNKKARTAGFYVFKASILLYVGRVEEAQRAIAHGLQLDPENGGALALKSVITLVLNDPEAAMRLAEQGAEAPSPGDAAASQIASSYVYQSQFDLDQALAHARSATELAPNNPLGWARIAELDLALGRLGAARRAAVKATSLNPMISRIQTTLGFAQLLRFETDAAVVSFKRAIALDQADPLPRLGLGLAKIHRGQLEDGRAEMEIAATIDPTTSIFRSYLGKAYYEEKRGALAATEYRIAKELDPRDPTPWFYDAILKETENRPVEALDDLQESIERNDNRAVYRSSLLLDRDAAVRGASTGRIYRDLGFDQLALVEGWKSLGLDPGNSSAHRLLADAYAELPGYRLAQVSELLQSQLRQPINAAPIQPLLAEAETLIWRGIGPFDLAYNEFNELFVSDGLNFQGNGIVGGNDIRGGDLVLTGIYGNLSLSAGRFYYQTDGIRPNNDQQQEIWDLFSQMQLTPDTSVQAEYRSRDLDYGDLTLRFDPSDFNPTQRVKEKTASFRVGLHHKFSESLDMIAHFRTQDSDSDLLLPDSDIDAFPNFDTSFLTDRKGSTAELQFLATLAHVDLLLGGGLSREDLEETLQLEGDALSCSIFFCGVTESEGERKHENVHLYSLLDYWDKLRITLGVALESYEDEDIDRSQISPKIGLIWNPNPQTTVRAAAFRTLSRPFVGDQTIEPTQVAGFNQLFDDAEGADSRNYGIAIDQRFSRRLFAGAAYLHRDLSVSGLDLTSAPPDVVEADHEAELGRAYVYWTPDSRWALRGEYLYERLVQSQALALDAFEEITDHRFSLGANYYHPSGLRAGLLASYVDQQGLFTPFSNNYFDDYGMVSVPGSDSFWTFDISVGYKLPKRLGLVSLTVKNLFDQDFRFQDTDAANPSFLPERLVTLTASLFF